MSEEDANAKAALESEQYTALRSLAQTLAPEPSAATARFVKGTVVSVQVASNQTTCTVQLGGDTSTSIPDVRVLDSYSPVAGDTVQIGMQGSEIFVIGQIMNTTPGANSANGWVQPTLGSGFTHSSDPIKYRVVTDNGDLKLQFRGSATCTSTATTLFTLPVGSRPAANQVLTVPRSLNSQATTALIEVNASGTVVLTGKTQDIGYATTGGTLNSGTGGGTTNSAGAGNSSQPISPPNFSGPYAATSYISGGSAGGDHIHNFDHVHSIGSHSHTISVNAHFHGMDVVDPPTAIWLSGLQTFL